MIRLATRPLRRVPHDGGSRRNSSILPFNETTTQIEREADVDQKTAFLVLLSRGVDASDTKREQSALLIMPSLRGAARASNQSQTAPGIEPISAVRSATVLV